MKRPPTPPDAEFQIQLAAYVEALGPTQSAKICGVSRRTLWLWLKGKVTPNLSTKVGALALLAHNLPPKEAQEAKPT